MEKNISVYVVGIYILVYNYIIYNAYIVYDQILSFFLIMCKKGTNSKLYTKKNSRVYYIIYFILDLNLAGAIYMCIRFIYQKIVQTQIFFITFYL